MEQRDAEHQMQVLTINEEQRLLRLLFSSDAKTFAAICSDFTASFAKQEDRLRACCAALLLLEVRQEQPRAALEGSLGLQPADALAHTRGVAVPRRTLVPSARRSA